MKIILFEAVDALGRPGQIVDVKAGYYRNFLGPRGLADLATESNLKRLAAKRRILDTKAATELDEAKSRAAELSAITLQFEMRADDKEKLYGSVGVADLARALEEKGVEVERRNIIISGPIKELGEHEIGIRLHPEVTAEIKVIVEKAAD